MDVVWHGNESMQLKSPFALIVEQSRNEQFGIGSTTENLPAQSSCCC